MGMIKKSTNNHYAFIAFSQSFFDRKLWSLANKAVDDVT
jgi:hypothetical protein